MYKVHRSGMTLLLKHLYNQEILCHLGSGLSGLGYSNFTSAATISPHDLFEVLIDLRD
jgi:hypothetical protein